MPRAEKASDDWDVHWNDYASAAASNPAQDYRRRLALRLLERGGAPARLLDIGSGQGDFLQVARRRWPGAELLGLEVSDAGIRESQAKVPDAGFLHRDLLVPEDPPAEYAAWATHSVCSEVLEHVDDPGALLASARRFLAPGCRLIVTVPGGRMSAFDRHIGHRRHYTPAQLGEVLAAAGFDVETVTGAGFPFFNVYRALIIARGARLVDDMANRDGERPPILARLAMAAFHALFRLNLPRSRWGTQIIGVASPPD